ncbi:AzlD domain-containing protein [Eupransor demetentiae]|uniref:Branched-chain amino acid transport protein (AzlD2) n=1 Tax=Eupransor demetentiae TaxID=3109584 RepID=A0ABM9N5K3_9LACO|nr:Branched-chain amino acid transport protein (AzlD2) [Lactobacillaceae bacterium LMG 33000]
MPSNSFVIITIAVCASVTWLSRVLPFLLLKKFKLSEGVVEFLSFVPIAIMSALWFQSLLIAHPGHLPEIDWKNLVASGPTLLAAILTKNLLLTVLIGIVSLAILNLF